MRAKPQPRGRELAELARRQHGVVSIRQLRNRLGFSYDAVRWLVAAGRLHCLYRGVFAVGHTDLGLHGHCLAAVLACGPGALLSHYSASWLWGLASTSPVPVHVTTPRQRGGRLPIRIHRSRTLAAADSALEENIPVTSVARTLLDQAALVDGRRLRRLLRRAEERRIFDLAAVHDALARNRGHRGRKPLTLALEIYEPPPFTRSEFEARFYEAVLAEGLPTPRVNFNVAGMEVDLFWPEHRLAVELDFFETHGTRASFEEDRLRRERLLLEGIEVVNVTGPRFAREPDVALARLRRLLAVRGGV